jgi:hypothetical protein
MSLAMRTDNGTDPLGNVYKLFPSMGGKADGESHKKGYTTLAKTLQERRTQGKGGSFS